MKTYKASELVKITDKGGNVTYGKARNTPMNNWTDYDIVPIEEVDIDS